MLSLLGRIILRAERETRGYYTLLGSHQTEKANELGVLQAF